MRKPLPSSLVLDQFSQERWGACRSVARLYQAAAELQDRNVLVRATQRHEIQSMLAFRGVTVPERSIATIDLPNKSLREQLPDKVARYVRVMDEAVAEVRTAPVGYVLRRVVRGLAGLSEDPRGGPGSFGTGGGLLEGTVTSDELPWRTAARVFGESAEDSYEAAVPPDDDLRDETDQMFEWMDTATGFTTLEKLSLGAYELRRLDPFVNTIDLLPIYVTLELIKGDDLQDQILPVSVHLDQNQARFDQVHRETVQTENFNGLVKFFADGLVEQAEHQLHVVRELAQLPGHYSKTYRDKFESKRRRDGFTHMLNVLPRFQIVTSELIADECGFTAKSAREYLRRAEDLEFVEHVDTRRQAKIYEVKGVRYAIDLYAGRARHRGRVDVHAAPDEDDRDRPQA